MNDPNVLNATTCTAPLSDLAHAAAQTNHQLFTTVIASIKRNCFNDGKKKKSEEMKSWQSAAIKVAACATKGDDGYCCANDWVRQFHALSDSEQGTAASCYAGPSTNFREVLKALNAGDCYRKRLENVLDALEFAARTKNAGLSIRQAAGLVRGCALLVADSADADDIFSDNDFELQSRAISQLIISMPQLASLNPCGIFFAVQSNILKQIHWNAFIKGGINFVDADSEKEFRSLLHFNVDKHQCKEEVDKSNDHAGGKRKRVPEEIISTRCAMTRHLLEAAHLARKGAVRAQHGAVIYIQSQNKGETKPQIIGRGWNHDYLLDGKKNKIVLHSESHAVADAIQNYGEDECFDELFPKATILIVELVSDYAYDTCHPCPKCHPMLRAVGITNVMHTAPDGRMEELDLSPANQGLLRNDVVSVPLGAACSEKRIDCRRLQKALASLKK